jgi:hypothetical protein
MHEDPEYKGPKEDCVEECKATLPYPTSPPFQLLPPSPRPSLAISSTAVVLTGASQPSFPPPALRNRLRGTPALQIPQIEYAGRTDMQSGSRAVCPTGPGGMMEEEREGGTKQPSIQCHIEPDCTAFKNSKIP